MSPPRVCGECTKRSAIGKQWVFLEDTARAHNGNTINAQGVHNGRVHGGCTECAHKV